MNQKLVTILATMRANPSVDTVLTVKLAYVGSDRSEAIPETDQDQTHELLLKHLAVLEAALRQIAGLQSDTTSELPPAPNC